VEYEDYQPKGGVASGGQYGSQISDCRSQTEDGWVRDSIICIAVSLRSEI